MRLRSKTTGEWIASPELRPALVADAEQQGISMTEVIVQILCKHVKITHVPTPRRTSPGANAEYLRFSVPAELAARLQAMYGNKWNDGIRAALSAHYGLRVTPAKRGRRKAAAA